MNKPVIVAPGWSYEKAIIASKYGAEEVYIWVPFTSLRMRQNKVQDFNILKKTIEEIHKNGSRHCWLWIFFLEILISRYLNL